MGSRWAYVLAVLVPLFGLLSLGLFSSGGLDPIRNLVFDTYQRLEPRTWNPDTPVRIVDIDDESLKRLGQWPWPRTRLAELVTRLGESGAAAVAFDMALSESDRTSFGNLISALPDDARERLAREFSGLPDNDAVLASAIGTAPVVLGTILTHGAPGPYPARHGIASAGDDPGAFLPTFRGAIVPLEMLQEKAAGFGALNWLPDQDQTVRRLPLLLSLDGKIVPALAIESLRVAQGASTYVVRASNASGQEAFGAKTGVNTVKVGALEIPTDPQGEVRVRFSPTQKGRFVPAWKVLDGSLAPGELEGRIVLIGTSAAGLLDQRTTPVNASVPGVEVHAQLLEHVLEGYTLARPDWAAGAELLIALIAGLGIAILLPRIAAAGTGLLGIIAIAALVFVSWHAFTQRNLLIDPLFPSATVAAVYLCGVVALYRAEQAQKKWVRDAFGRFVSPAVVQQLTKDPSKLVLGGETREITVMFCDIRGFTTISEGMSAAELTAFMNAYLDPLSDVVLEHRATLDKYIGDAIMAFWNAPLDDADHARQAALASLAMIAELERLNAGWRKEAEAAGRPFREVRFGIGLATGPCSVGNFGSTQRFDYSAFGDDVNLSSRLEGASKTYGVTILASEATRAAAPDLAWLEVDIVKVKGKTEAVRIFTLLGDAVYAAQDEFRKIARWHEHMLSAFHSRKFRDAEEAARSAAGSAPFAVRPLYLYYAEASRRFAEMPPPDDWDGVTEFMHK